MEEQLGSTGVLTVEEEALQLYQAFIDNTLNASQRFFLDENSEISDEIFNFFKVNGFSLRNRAFAKAIIINEITPEVSPETPIYDIRGYLKCFNLNQSAKVTIHSDQPLANSGTPYTITPFSVGHSFITIKQGNEIMTLGFYPESGTGFFLPTKGIMGNDSSHSYDVSISLNVSPAQLSSIIEFSVEYNIGTGNYQYDLDTNNCTDFAIQVGNIAGLDLPECNSSWPLGGGSSPGQFGQYLRTITLPQGATRNTSGGTAPSNNKTCN